MSLALLACQTIAIESSSRLPQLVIQLVILGSKIDDAVSHRLHVNMIAVRRY